MSKIRRYPWSYFLDSIEIEALHSLDSKESAIIRFKKQGMSFEDIGEVFDLTRERIRQIFISSIISMGYKHESKNS